MAITSKQPFQSSTSESLSELKQPVIDSLSTHEEEVISFDDFKKNDKKRVSLSQEYLKQKIKEELMLFNPDKYVPEQILTTKDIWEHRYILKQVPYNDKVIKHLIEIIIIAIEQRQRFRKLDCLKVINRILYNRVNSCQDDINVAENKVVTNKLFYLYQSFLDGSNSQEIQKCVNMFLKNRQLDEEQIQWLVKNHTKSEYAINRLLRYPGKSPTLFYWAKELYLNKFIKYREERKTLSDWYQIEIENNLLKRESELIAILIDEDIPSFVDIRDKTVIMWAIYYSQVPDVTKERLIKKYWNIEGWEAAIKVSKRLNYLSVREWILENIESMGIQ
jgi:hypothetical protein